MVVITAVVLVNNGKFGGVVRLQNLAYDMALSIRQAQVYGISVARFGDDTFDAGYGMHFDISSPTTYALFADALDEENGLYDCDDPINPTPDNCELVETTTITGKNSIIDLCTTSSSGAETCGVAKVDVVFIRPEPDAWISVSDNSCILNNNLCQKSARIKLSSPRGDTISIVIDANGQISVKRPNQ